MHFIRRYLWLNNINQGIWVLKIKQVVFLIWEEPKMKRMVVVKMRMMIKGKKIDWLQMKGDLWKISHTKWKLWKMSFLHQITKILLEGKTKMAAICNNLPQQWKNQLYFKMKGYPVSEGRQGNKFLLVFLNRSLNGEIVEECTIIQVPIKMDLYLMMAII